MSMNQAYRTNNGKVVQSQRLRMAARRIANRRLSVVLLLLPFIQASYAQQPAALLPANPSAQAISAGTTNSSQAASQPSTDTQPRLSPDAQSRASPDSQSQPSALSPAPATLPSAIPSAAPSQSKGSIQRVGGDRLQLNFRDADIDTVAAAFSHLLGRQILVDARVKGRMSLESSRPLTKDQALALFQSALRMQLFAMVHVGDSLRVVPEVDAKLHGGPVQQQASLARSGEEVITRVFRLRYELANNILPIIRPLVPPNNTISAMASNNSLVVTDYSSNLERIAQLIEELDAPVKAEFVSIAIKHASASEVALLVSRLLEASEVGANDARLKVSLVPEPRSNALLVRSASPARIEQVRQLIDQVDQPSGKPGNIHVVYLKNAEATRLAQTLRGILSGEGTSLGGSLAGASGFGASGAMMNQGLGGGSGGLTHAGAAAQQGLGSSSMGPNAMGGAAGFAGTGFGATPQGGGALGLGGQNMAMGASQSGQLGVAGASGPASSINRLGAVVIAADAATNSLIITASEPVFRDIRAVIDKLDVRRAQVYIESLIVEVNADKAAELGFQWQFLNGTVSGASRAIGGTNLSARGEGTNILDLTTNVLGAAQGLNIGVIRNTPLPGAGSNTAGLINLGVLANALQSRANGNVLATPNLLTLDNEEARIIIGQNVPFVTGSYVNTGAGGGVVNPFQTVERRDVGTTLRVRPQVSEGGTVKLAIYQEVSSIQDKTLSAGLITNRRAIESNVLVDDGQIIVLGGLIEDRSSGDTQSVPILGDIPIAGQLFRYDARSRNKTNLLVFLRPRVLRSAEAANALTQDRYEFMRAVQQEQTLPGAVLMPKQEAPVLPEVPR
ncbi:MAG: type II secretion system protein GspD [Burkholderiaceae bacterium]|nr:type II secretion system protein GspD [Burkholderiaceae bacterium]